MTDTAPMCPRVGDTIELFSPRAGELERRGRVLEVIAESGQRRFRVLWDDGRVTVIDPSSDAIVLRAAG
jgi:hypothetical protein